MALNFINHGEGFNGLNLSDYYTRRQGFNSVVYIRKQFPKLVNQNQNDTSKDISVINTEDTIRSQQRGKDQHDKSPSICKPQQMRSPHILPKEKRKSKSTQHNGESVLEQTVKFVKNIVPLVLPSEGSPPVYTIKGTRVTSKKEKKVKRHNKETQNVVVNQEHKSLIETFRKENCVGESSSMRESLSHSSRSNTTVERINLNQSLGFSVSDLSEKKQYRYGTPKDAHKANQQQNRQKLIASESLEALAADISRSVGCTKIKIQLMNEQDKALLSDSIKAPVLQAIVQCVEIVMESCKADKSELSKMQNKVQCNSEKLDIVLNKLACITDSLSKVNNETSHTTPRIAERHKASTLETLGQDLAEIKEDSFEHDEVLPQNPYARNGKENEVRVFSPIQVTVKNQWKNKLLKAEGPHKPNLGGGETRDSLDEVLSSKTKHVMNGDSTQGIPTRFCWTDVNDYEKK